VGPQLPGQRRLLLTAGDGRHAKAHPVRELDGQVAEAADALDRHKIAGPGGRVSERVAGRHAGAQQGRRVRRREICGNSCQGALIGDHHLGVAAVLGNTGNRLVLAVHDVTLPAGRAAAAMAARKPTPTRWPSFQADTPSPRASIVPTTS
jgi:hypothetical protein